MTKNTEILLQDPEIRKSFEEELLFGEVTETLAALIESLGLTQREVSQRLDVSEARVSQVLSGAENLTLRSLASYGFALGIRFDLDPVPLAADDRIGTPAENDRPAPAWLTRMHRRAGVYYKADLDMPTRPTHVPNLRLVKYEEAAFAA